MAAAFIAIKAMKRRGRQAEEEELDGIDESEDKPLSTEGSQPSAATAVAASAETPEPDGFDKAAPIGRPPREILWRQFQVWELYRHNIIQIPIAFIIGANFFITILEKEIDPYSIQLYPDVWKTLDIVFNAIFAIELAMNMYGAWFFTFWRGGWNIFDFIVVLAGILTMANVAALSQLKMLRAFRIFRLFKRIKALNQIVTALVKAIPGVFNAFLIMLIIMAIYAILAVEFFSEMGTTSPCLEDNNLHCYFTNKQIGIPGQMNATVLRMEVSSVTPRELPYGYEYYGTFFRALYTLFQVLTGESWSEAVARPLIFGHDPGHSPPTWFSAIFFASFILLTQIVLVNVVVAVLLDQFVTEPEAVKDVPAVITASSRENESKAEDQNRGGSIEEQLISLQESVDALKLQFDSVGDLKQLLETALQRLDTVSAAAGNEVPAVGAGTGSGATSAAGGASGASSTSGTGSASGAGVFTPGNGGVSTSQDASGQTAGAAPARPRAHAGANLTA